VGRSAGPGPSATWVSDMPAQRLDRRAWTLGESPDEWPRSRYSAVALRPGQMAVTVIVSWAELFGHSYIAFEWFADELPGPRTGQRRHEVYQLRADPTEAERARGIISPDCPKLLSWRTRPASVVVECDLGFFPLRNAAGRELTAYYRAWLVPFADGWRAREVAAVAATYPPHYNFLELGGGKNCARWVLEVAAVAGIDAGHWLSSVVAVPKRLVRRGEPILEEGRMWQRRQASRSSHLSDLAQTRRGRME
jgi:hypothetical protein